MQDNEALTAFFWHSDALRSRSVGTRVYAAALPGIPALPARLVADWAHEITARLFLEPGDVEPLPLARARMRWPDFKHCVQAMDQWLAGLGMSGVLPESELSLMACRGARYHHDAEQYGAAAFCNLFVSDDAGLDVHFPGTGDRIPLRRGTALLFDTAQPHAVVRRGRSGFDAEDFADAVGSTQYFLSWELPMARGDVARALGVSFDVDNGAAVASTLDEAQVQVNGARVAVCRDTGRWRAD